MAGKGGGAWKVAYADFVTAMMAFFMVMWLVGQNEETKEAVEHYFQEPTIQLLPAWTAKGPQDGGGSYRKHKGPPGPDDDYKNGKNPKQRRGEVAKQMKLIIRTEGDSSFTGTVIPFADEVAALDDAGQKELKQLMPILKGKSNRIEVRGHTTRRLHNNDPAAQWQVSFARAMAVKNYMEEAGIEASRIRLSVAGTHEPPPESEDGATPHESRVEVFLLSEFVDGPAFDDGHVEKHDDDHGDKHGDDEHGDGKHGEDKHDDHAKKEDEHAPAKKETVAPQRSAKSKAAAAAKAAEAKKADAHGGGHGGGGHGAKPPAKKPEAKKPAAKKSGGHGGH